MVFFNLFIFGRAGSLLLHGLFYSCVFSLEQGPLSSFRARTSCGVVASLVEPPCPGSGTPTVLCQIGQSKIPRALKLHSPQTTSWVGVINSLSNVGWWGGIMPHTGFCCCNHKTKCELWQPASPPHSQMRRLWAWQAYKEKTFTLKSPRESVQPMKLIHGEGAVLWLGQRGMGVTEGKELIFNRV